MTAGRSAGNGNLIRVNSQLLGVRSQPTNCALHILHSGRKRRLARKTIACSRNHITVLGEFRAVVVIDLSVAAGPSTAVNEKDYGEGLRPLFGRIKVQLKYFVAALSVFNIF